MCSLAGITQRPMEIGNVCLVQSPLEKPDSWTSWLAAVLADAAETADAAAMAQQARMVPTPLGIRAAPMVVPEATADAAAMDRAAPMAERAEPSLRKSQKKTRIC